MESKLDRTVADALALPAHLRAFLAETLIESLDFQADFEISSEWMDEIHARCRELETAEELLPAADVLAQLREQVG
jgi:hypothetical protein